MRIGATKNYGIAAAATIAALAAAAGLAGPAAADSNKAKGCVALFLYGGPDGYTAHAFNSGRSRCDFVGYIVIDGPGLKITTEPSRRPRIPYLPGKGSGPVNVKIFRDSDKSLMGEVELKVH